MSQDALHRDLLRRSAEGDRIALGRLVEQTTPDVWRLCTSLGSAGEIDDLVQETYLRMIRSMPGYRGDAPVRLWILAIARNVCADHVRRRQRQRRLIGRLTERYVSDSVPPPPDPHPWLDDLSPERREAFVLTQVLDLSYEDAASIAGCPVGTIRSRVHRAREDLTNAVRHEARSG
ncbi:MAG TPA: sigma-70 family RNA polymerase sigma factor [Microthrixaceae bacterium]|nr:sigma-70 family RNA polymerase sigma factor [Microthrixaceae bacterium]